MTKIYNIVDYLSSDSFLQYFLPIASLSLLALMVFN